MRYTRADQLLLAYLLVLFTATAGHDMARERSFIAALVLALLTLAALAPHHRVLRVAHDFAAAVVVVGCYALTGPVVDAIHPARLDSALAGADRSFFGDLGAVWRGTLGRPAWLTDAAGVAYVAWYFIPVAIAVALYRREERRDFDDFVFTVVATFVASFIGYAVIPATGPRVAPAVVDQLVGGGAISRAVRTMLGVMTRRQLDAFPSGHTALALIYAGVGARLFPAWRVPLAAAACAIVFSTVYLTMHYVVDVAGGAVLALMVLVAWGIRDSASARSLRLRSCSRSMTQ